MAAHTLKSPEPRATELLTIQRSETPSAVKVHLTGKMTANGIGDFRRQVEDARRRRKCVHIDMGEVTLLDRVSAEYLNSIVCPQVRFDNTPPYIARWIRG